MFLSFTDVIEIFWIRSNSWNLGILLYLEKKNKENKYKTYLKKYFNDKFVFDNYIIINIKYGVLTIFMS